MKAVVREGKCVNILFWKSQLLLLQSCFTGEDAEVLRIGDVPRGPKLLSGTGRNRLNSLAWALSLPTAALQAGPGHK